MKRPLSPVPDLLAPSTEQLHFRNLIEAAASGLPEPTHAMTRKTNSKPIACPETFGNHMGLFRVIGGFRGWEAVFVHRTHDAPPEWLSAISDKGSQK